MWGHDYSNLEGDLSAYGEVAEIQGWMMDLRQKAEEETEVI